ncbi:MAG: hypothetical protein JST26_13775 [Bacteroidetes bacterium]|nr:hypothetical protein [Bacteroidota bacterium]
MNATVELLKLKIELTLQQETHCLREHEVTDLLSNELPVINESLEKADNPHNIYTVMQSFADFTKQFIKQGNLKETMHCFTLADTMLKHGNATVRNAIENGYLYSISGVIEMAGQSQQLIKNMLSDTLRKEYNRQVCASGL